MAGVAYPLGPSAFIRYVYYGLSVKIIPEKELLIFTDGKYSLKMENLRMCC